MTCVICPKLKLILIDLACRRISITTTGSVYFDVGSHVVAWEVKFLTQEVFPLKWESMWWHGIVKFLTQEVFPLMQEAMLLSGKLKFFDRKFCLYAGSYFPCRKLKFLSQEVVPLMRVEIWSNHKLKSFPQQVFTLMREAMLPHQNLKIFPQEVFYLMQEAMCVCMCVCVCVCVHMYVCCVCCVCVCVCASVHMAHILHMFALNTINCKMLMFFWPILYTSLSPKLFTVTITR